MISDVPSSTKVKTMSHAIRRVVTGHDDNGKAIVESDGFAPNVKIREGAGFVSTLLWVTDETPANVGLRQDRADRTIAVAPPANGTILRIVDFPPVTPEAEAMDGSALRRAMGVDHGDAPSRHAYMHRTKSVDYAIVLSGEIDMLLDDSEVHLKAGDILIQQATNHAWVNRSNDFCKIAFVLIDAHDPLAQSA
jgi:mannose-6-phosphate isomerase-like protein (cupin superfamily)